jgi:hypothetical protein
MDQKEIAALTGQAGGERVPAFKLNEVKMSGDTGKFSLREILGTKGADGKYPVQELGDIVRGVILKMRWRLTRYEETPDGKGGKISTTWMTSEFDNKNIDNVVLFNSGEKGLAADIKVKHNLGSQRVLYVFVPGLKQTVRVIVKASALSGDKNPGFLSEGGPFGLFEYVDSFFMANGEYMHEFLTEFTSIYREDKTNPRKSYFAMTFKRGKAIEVENKAKIIDMIKEVHEKVGTAFADTYVPPAVDVIEYPTEEINPDDVPF